MGWSKFSPGTGQVFPGFQVNIKIEGGWVHYLVAPLDEPEPHRNHIHLKTTTDLTASDCGVYLVCDVKVDGIREVNRRELIEGINRATGLDISYR